MRIVACAGANTMSTPRHVTDYCPDAVPEENACQTAVAYFRPRLRFSLAFGPITLSNRATTDWH